MSEHYSFTAIVKRVRRWLVSTIMPLDDKTALEQARYTVAWRIDVMTAEKRKIEALSSTETLAGLNRILWSNKS